MGWFSLLALALALAMDAFAVAIVTALALAVLTKRHVFRLSFHFALFQALMLIAGWLIGATAYKHVASADHWIAFAFLAFVGAKMIWGTARDNERSAIADRTRGWDLVLLSVATSIDALAVGLSLAMLDSGIGIPAVVVGTVAGALTIVGMVIGRRAGLLWGKRVEALGGIVLIVIGIKIVWQHMFM